MTHERQIQEVIARCVSIVVCYYRSERTRQSTLWMAAEATTVATEVRELGLNGADTNETILRPLENELYARFGHELGHRLTVDFAKAFDGSGIDQRSEQPRHRT